MAMFVRHFMFSMNVIGGSWVSAVCASVKHGCLVALFVEIPT